jgi:hypothetical protein
MDVHTNVAQNRANCRIRRGSIPPSEYWSRERIAARPLINFRARVSWRQAIAIIWIDPVADEYISARDRIFMVSYPCFTKFGVRRTVKFARSLTALWAPDQIIAASSWAAFASTIIRSQFANPPEHLKGLRMDGGPILWMYLSPTAAGCGT